MYKLVIIDDEPLILRGIQNIIDWKKFDFSDIRTFSNPLQAYNSILEEPPDVILSDIRMPVITGLDLLKSCRKAQLKTLFVLISAYSEFEYAKLALESGAFSYILKPLNKDAMLELAGRLRESLSAARHTELQHGIRTLVLQALTTGTASESDVPSGIEFLNHPYRICFTARKPVAAGMWVTVYDDLAIGLLPQDMNIELATATGFSRIANKSDALFESIREALTAYYTLRFYGIQSGKLFFKSGKSPLTRYADEITQAIAAKNHKRVKHLLPIIKEQVKEQLVQIDEIAFFYNRLVSAFNEIDGRSCFGEEIRPFGNYLSMYSIFSNADIMFESLYVLAENACNRYSENRADSKAAVLAAIRYVDENYMKVVTLEQLAERFHISLSYLSRQIKHVTGFNFSEYLKNKRIAYACKLLKTSSLPVHDVGALSGYADYFYFNKTFKKVTGLTPAKYRERGKHDA